MNGRHPRFRDRADAGRRLAVALDEADLRLGRDPLVIGIPRGGLPVATEVALHFGAPLDLVVARKMGAPGQPEYGFGAVAEGGGSFVDRDAAYRLGMGAGNVERRLLRCSDDVDAAVARYRTDRPFPAVGDRDVVLVDDGLATGVTATAAIRSLGLHDPHRMVLAVPVGPIDRLTAIAHDEGVTVVAVAEPRHLRAVGEWYDDFTPTTDTEVLDLLARCSVQPPELGAT